MCVMCVRCDVCVHVVVCVKLPQQHQKRVVPTADRIRPMCFIEVYVCDVCMVWCDVCVY